MKIAKLMVVLFLLAACRGERAADPAADAARAENAAASAAQEARELAEAPMGMPRSAEELERDRFDARWRQLQSFQAARDQRGAAAAAAKPAVNVTFNTDPKYKETLENLNPEALESLPVVVPITGDRRGPSVLRAQVYLDRMRFSPGIIDGRWGKNSEIAVYWFQRQNGLPPTGEVDQATYSALAANAGGTALARHTLTADDLKGPFTKIPDDVYEQEKLDCLCYESVAEKLGERFHTSPEFLALLNPDVNFDAAAAGQQIWVPNVRPPSEQQSAAGAISRVVVSVEGNYLHALDGAGNILLHAPTTLGSEYDPSPTETLEVKKVTFDPWFHYQPKLFHEVDDSEAEANLAPGPNSPVGVVWAALSKRHFGIHGTKDPGSIGYASSHGCVRLTNWDAREVAGQLKPGTTVEFVDTRSKSNG